MECIVTVSCSCLLNILADYASVEAGIVSDLADRFLKSTQNDLNTCSYVAFCLVKELLYSRDRIDECRTAACDNTFFNSCLCSSESILNTELLLLHLCLCCSTDLDNSYAAGELCKSLLELLFVVIGLCLFELCSDLADT